MSDEYDVVKMDFPPYEEEYPSLPDPEVTAEPFYKIKEEVYRRNRAIAAEQQAALLDFSTQSFDTTDYAEKCDEDFQIPIGSILEYLT